jgi:MscS family membrane protein
MKRSFFRWAAVAAFLWAWSVLPGADAPSGGDPAPAGSSLSQADRDRETMTTAAAAVAATRGKAVRTPDFLEHVVDSILALFDVRTSGNTATHYVISMIFLVGAVLLRHVVTNIIFGILKRFAARTQTTLDDKLFPALEGPVATLIMVTGIFSALKVLKFTEDSDRYIGYGSTVAFSLVIFWGLLRAFNAVLDHAHEVARERQMSVAAFMPWIKKTLVAMFVVIGVLLVIQSLGGDVRAILGGLGIGGLAFALAAQDTIANLFGSLVVATDQPFRIGETVRIGTNVGMVEDIGLRSTKIRLIDKSLMVIPNKTVAAETITNLARFTQRRVEQVIGLTYDTKPEQMAEMVEEFRRIILAEPEVDPASVMVFFRDYSASSLDIWVVYLVNDPDFQKAMRLRQRVNLAFMRAVEQRGLSFAFPTQTLHFAGDVAQKIAERGGPRA